MEQFVNYGRAWQELLQRAGVPYKKRSTGVFVISCIFHDDKTASLHCWPLSGRFHCHGCGEDGTIQEFMQRALDIHDDFMEHKWRTIACYTFLPGEREAMMEELRRHGKAPDLERKLPPTSPHGNEYAEYAHLCATQWHDLNID